MLTFLRRIRKGLIDSGSTQKYLLYAIGEVLLVMIGILLALQVNNWNQDRQTRILEHQLTLQLIDDLKADKERLSFLDSSYANVILSNRKAIELFQQANDISDIRDMIHLPDWWARNLALQTSTFNEMINSGSLYSIRNKTALKAITKHYKSAEKYDQYTKEYHASVMAKWNQPAFAPFGSLIAEHENESSLYSVDSSWIGQKAHPTFKAALFALEYNFNALMKKQRIVRAVYNSTADLLDLLENSLELE